MTDTNAEPSSIYNPSMSGLMTTVGSGNGGGGNPLAALNIARNAGNAYGPSYNPRGRGPLNPQGFPSGLSVSSGNMGSDFPLTQPITSKEGEEAHDATNLKFEVAAWNPNADEQNFSTHLEEGDPVFVAPGKNPRGGIYEMFNVGQLNKLLRDEYQRVMERARIESRATQGGGEVTQFLALLREFGESGLSEYVSNYNKGTTKDMYPDDSDGRSSRLAEFHRLSTTDKFYCMTSHGIRSRWRFVGIFMNSSDPKRIHGSQKLGYSRKLVANVTVRGEFQSALNLWGGYSEVDSMSKLFFVLRKARAKNSDFAHFELVPWGSRDRASIPRSLARYEDHTGAFVDAVTYYVGFIQQPSYKETISMPQVYMAMGLTEDSHDKIRESAAPLDKIRIEVRMK